METIQMASKRRDWAHLPPELVETIAGFLTEVPDHLRLRCVCAPWRSATARNPTLIPPPSPWLLLPRQDAATSCRLFSFTERRTYALPLPEPRHCRIFSSPTGWLIIATSPDNDPSSPLAISLFNPLTRSSIPLPPLPLPRIKKLKLVESELGLRAVAIAHGAEPGVFAVEPGRIAWSRLELGLPQLADHATRGGKNFVVVQRGRRTFSTWVVDGLDRRKVFGFPMAKKYLSAQLVDTPSKELLLVLRRGALFERKRFDLMRLDESDPRRLRWVEVRSIGGNVIFVDFDGAMSFNSGNFRGNCIYFVEHGLEDYKVRLFDIEKGKVDDEKVPSFLDGCKTRERPMWMVPSL